MRLVSADIQTYDRNRLEISTEFGQPTIVLGPNGSGKSRLLDLLEALLETNRSEYRHATSPDVKARRLAAYETVEELEDSPPTLVLELDQLSTPGSWDREFFAMHVGPYVLSELGQAAQISPEAAIEQALHFETDGDASSDLRLMQFDEPTRVEYLVLLRAIMRECRYVITGQFESEWPLEHAPALLATDLPDEMWALAKRLQPVVYDAWSEGFGPVEEAPAYRLMEHAAKDQRPTGPFIPGLDPCGVDRYSSCSFPDFEIVRFGPNSPSIRSLLDDLAKYVLDHEGVDRPRTPGDINEPGVYGYGDGVFRLRHEGVLAQWEEILSDLFSMHLPDFARSAYSGRLRLIQNQTGDSEPLFMRANEVLLRADLSVDPETHVGSGIRNWCAYALARTAAEVRRRRRVVPGDMNLKPARDEAVTTERPLLLLLDEPEAHLHMGLQRAVADWLAEESMRDNQTVVVATHAPAFLAVASPDRRFLPLVEGRGQVVPSEAVGLLELAGAGGEDLVATSRGFLFVEGKHEKQIYEACFGAVLRDNNIRLVPGSGAYGAAGQCAFLSTFGKRVAVILDRVRPVIAETESPDEQYKWPETQSNEEREVQKIFKMHSSIRRVKCIPFRPHDVIGALPEGLIREALKNLRLRPSTDVWTWTDIEKSYEKGPYRFKPGGFKTVFLKHVGLLQSNDRANDHRLDDIVGAVCALFQAGAAAPPEIKVAFSQAMHFLEGREEKWVLPSE